MKNLKLQHGMIRRVLAIAMATAMITALGSIGPAVRAQQTTAANIEITISGPAQVKVGEIIHLRLESATSNTIAGFETLLLYSHTDAEFAGFAPAQPAPNASTGQLVVPEIPGGSAVGYYTCATAPCLARRELQLQAAAEPGLIAEVELLALNAGPLQVALSHLQAVDAGGVPVAITLNAPSIIVQVGEGGAPHSAPADTWTLGAKEAGAQVAAVAAADVTQDGAVSHSDLMEVAMAWEVTHESGQPCDGSEATADINGDGCVNILDIQSVAGFANHEVDQPGAEAAATGQQGDDQLFIPQAASDAEASDAEAGDAETAAMAVVQPITVNSIGDENDADLDQPACATGKGTCTLRAAIQQANHNPGPDVIKFAIAGSEVQTINLKTRLPSLNDSTGGTTIDGYSQPGAVPNSDPMSSNAKIRIEIRGQGFTLFDGLPITSAGNVVKGLAFFNLKRSLWIYGSGAHDNVISGDFLGTNAAGTFSASDTSTGQAHGLHIEQGAYQNHIGGAKPAERNVISGNARSGMGLWHVGTKDNVIINNIVGLSPNGLHRLHNHQQGIDINYGASSNKVGGVAPGERNVVSGNEHNGIEITHGEETTLNEIRGNFVGTDLTGEGGGPETANTNFGISLHDRIENNLVAENVVGNNRNGGVLVDNFHTCCVTENRIENNWIGVSPQGAIIGNRGITEGVGISLTAKQTHIGPGNVIAYNLVGIQIRDDSHEGNTISNTITQNSIYSNTFLGIDIAPLGEVNLNDEGDPDGGPNGLLNFPVLDTISPTTVTGSACAGCRIEVFIADRKMIAYGQGKSFVGAGSADAGGVFSVTLSGVHFGDYLTATATDSGGNTSEFSLNRLVKNPANQPPTAADDSAVTDAGTPVTINVLANDSDPEKDALSIVAFGAVAHGTAAISGDSFVYTPTAGFSGSDLFTYTVSDNSGGNSDAKVTVTVVKGTGGTNGAGVRIVPGTLSLTLGGQPVSYSVVLKSKPAAAVTLKTLADAPLSAAPAQLVFTPNNWDKPQTVTVSLNQASVASVIQQSVIRHSVQSTDGDYNNLGVANLVVSIVQLNTIFLPSLNR